MKALCLLICVLLVAAAIAQDPLFVQAMHSIAAGEWHQAGSRFVELTHTSDAAAGRIAVFMFRSAGLAYRAAFRMFSLSALSAVWG